MLNVYVKLTICLDFYSALVHNENLLIIPNRTKVTIIEAKKINKVLFLSYSNGIVFII